MQPFTQTNQYAEITQYFASIKEPTVPISTYSQTIVDAILRSEHFTPICQTISAIQSYQGQLLATADLALVELTSQQIILDRPNRQKYVDKLRRAIQKMQASLGIVEDYHSTAMSKLQWIQSQALKIEQGRQQIQQEIEIMTCQNNLKTQSKRGPQKGSKKLQQLLKYYECPNGFFRNKTQILMHINRIEARIQHLQMNKLRNYARSQQ